MSKSFNCRHDAPIKGTLIIGYYDIHLAFLRSRAFLVKIPASRSVYTACTPYSLELHRLCSQGVQVDQIRCQYARIIVCRGKLVLPYL